MIWRNVHNRPLSELDLLLRDARKFPHHLFKMVYGPEVYRYVAPDNTPRILCESAKPIITAYKPRLNERLAQPAKKDKVVIIEDDTEVFGHIVFISRDDDNVGIFIYNTKSVETFSLDCLETNRGKGNIRWRIHQ